MALPSMLDEIDRLFDELIRQPWGVLSRPVSPAAIREVAGGWVVEIPVEGLRAEDLHVEVHGRRLVVTGQRRSDREQRHGTSGWSRSQQDLRLHQTITLPADVNPDDLEARIDGTRLTIRIQRRTP